MEQNASDLRNKRSLLGSLTGVIDNTLLNFGRKKLLPKVKRNFLILMDEVDGMKSDRGGSTALLELIKKTKVPIVCIANDR